MVYHLCEDMRMLEYNPIPTNKSQFKEGTQIPSKKRIRNKKYKNVFNEIKDLKKNNRYEIIDKKDHVIIKDKMTSLIHSKPKN